MFSLKKAKKNEADDAIDEDNVPASEQTPDKTGDDKPVKKKGRAGVGQPFLLVMLLVLLAALGSAAALWLNAGGLLQQAAGSGSQQAFQQSSRLFAEVMRGRIEAVRLLAADPATVRLFAENDQEGLQAVARQLTEKSPDILRLNFVRPGELAKDDDQVAPVSYASIDLVNRAVSQKNIPAVEMHSPGSARSHIAIAAPVLDGDQTVIGVVHAALSPLLVTDMLESTEKALLSIRIEQVVGENVVELGSVGNFAGQMVAGTADIAQTIWRASYQTAPVTVSPGSLWGLYVIAALALLFIVLLVLLQGAFRKSVVADAEGIAEFIRGRAGDDRATDPAMDGFRYAEFEHLARTIAEINFGGKKSAFMGKKITRKAASADKTDQKPKPAESSEPAKAVPDAAPAEDKEKAPAGSGNGVFPSKVSQSSGEISAVESSNASINPLIFREYDIRGIVGDTLKEEDAYGIGQAIGTMAVQKGQTSIIVGRDGRLSSKELSGILVRGLVDSGLDVIDIGLVPTPVLYFATATLDTNSGVMVTGSHNPQNYNGFKVIIAGETLRGEDIRELLRLLQNEDELVVGVGEVKRHEILNSYVDRIKSDINLLNKPSIVVDCGHGAAGVIAEKLFTTLGCEVRMMFDNIDGNFPDHHPDPGNPENLQSLIAKVRENDADIGIAFDGDGDRIGVVDSAGNIINPDRLLMLLSADLLMRNPGVDIVYDVKSSKALASHILASGGNPVMYKSGHSLMKAKLKESGALLAGEFSGHIFYAERWYGFDDALYTAARLLEIVSAEGRPSVELFAGLPNPLSTPEIRVDVEEGTQHDLVKAIHEQAMVLFGDARIIDLDGVRAEYENGWGIIRASNTTPSLTLRFEADNETAMEEIKDNFRSVLAMIAPDAALSF